MKVEYKFDPFKITGIDDEGLTKAQKKSILDDIADLVLTSVLDSVGSSKSPVSGHGSFKSLNKDYAEREHGGDTKCKLELSGSMLDGLKVKNLGDELVLTVSEKQQPKADGHNNFSGESKLPLRRFIPKEDDGETFDKKIIQEIRLQLRDAIDEYKTKG